MGGAERGNPVAAGEDDASGCGALGQVFELDRRRPEGAGAACGLLLLPFHIKLFRVGEGIRKFSSGAAPSARSELDITGCSREIWGDLELFCG